jgi:hypothetical protein
MRRSAQVVAAGALLVMLAMMPALAAACALSCDLAGGDAPAQASCHDTGHAGARLAADVSDPCDAHDRAAAERATRTLREQSAAAAAPDAKAAVHSQLRPHRRLAAVTPGPPRPAPTRPPLVLRV